MQTQYAYSIITCGKLAKLENKVNIALADGWILAGGVSLAGSMFIQAVYKQC